LSTKACRKGLHLLCLCRVRPIWTQARRHTFKNAWRQFLTHDTKSARHLKPASSSRITRMTRQSPARRSVEPHPRLWGHLGPVHLTSTKPHDNQNRPSISLLLVKFNPVNVPPGGYMFIVLLYLDLDTTLIKLFSVNSVRIRRDTPSHSIQPIVVKLAVADQTRCTLGHEAQATLPGWMTEPRPTFDAGTTAQLCSSRHFMSTPPNRSAFHTKRLAAAIFDPQ